MTEIKKEFVIDQHGKQHVLYAGLLDAAHEMGLLSIETTLIQIPGAENGHVAICQATVRLAGEGGTVRSFSGIADAAPDNVNRMMANALIRMAETRSKARALRDAINLGELDIEGADQDEPAPASVKPRTTQAASNGKVADDAETDRLKKAQDWYGRLVKVAQEQGVEYTPIKSLPNLEAIVSEGKALRHRLGIPEPAKAQ